MIYNVAPVSSVKIVFTTEDREELKEKTQINSLIKFGKCVQDEYGHFRQKEISGIVTDKYSFTFRLDDGHIYSWDDYLLGYIY